MKATGLGQACRGLGLLLGVLAGLGLVWWLPRADYWAVPRVSGVVIMLAAISLVLLRVGSRLLGRPRPRLGAGFAAFVTVAVVVAAIRLYQDVGLAARLSADQGTVAALRAAAAIYYGKNGTLPTRATLQTLVQPSPPVFQCTGATWSLDTTNGKITYIPNDLGAGC